MNNPKTSSRIRAHTITLSCLVAGMVMLAYASVPLYRIFCETTGFGGTTRRAESDTATIVNRIMRVDFNADTDPNLPWKFAPVQRFVDVKLGANTLIAYNAENLSNEPITGVATYNVTPHEVGRYFIKIQCFCFEEQMLAPHEKVNMPVSFYIDPAILDDPEARDITQVTLSYTFFASAEKTIMQRVITNTKATK